MGQAPSGGATAREPAGGGGAPPQATSDLALTIISVDDHLVEPADTFTSRLPARLAERAPRVVEHDGTELWDFDGQRHGQIGLNAVVGRPREEWSLEPARFDEMRRGCFDVDQRVADMDLDGVYASLCYPSLIAGFAGTMFARCSDPDLGFACMQAWNDWHLEEWAGAHPDRLIPLQLPWLLDPTVAAGEIRRNAERGFKAVSFVENPVEMGLPTLHTDHWDPFLAACEETETVICLHCASGGWSASHTPGAPLEQLTTLFPVNALVTCADWLWSGVLLRFPGLRICLAESGVDWVPMLANRIDYVMDHSASGQGGWPAGAMHPTDVLRRNFWFGVIDVTPTIGALGDQIGLNHIVLESDYPHADSTWPDTQALATEGLAGMPASAVRKITWENAATLFRHPVPDDRQLPEGKPGL
ncbi:MAG: amidohydrolase [Actinobacteria bacterium]|nr:amidohydrolase [Actinomycetota bacterium]